MGRTGSTFACSAFAPTACYTTHIAKVALDKFFVHPLRFLWQISAGSRESLAARTGTLPDAVDADRAPVAKYYLHQVLALDEEALRRSWTKVRYSIFSRARARAVHTRSDTLSAMHTAHICNFARTYPCSEAPNRVLGLLEGCERNMTL